MNDSEFKADVVVKSSTQWTALNPHLNQNDLCIESDTGRMKVGVGKTWSATNYVGPTPIASDEIVFVDANSVENTISITSGLITGWAQV